MATAAKAARPAASPSRPSARFTAFEAPVTTSTTNGGRASEVDHRALEERHVGLHRSRMLRAGQK